MVGLAQPMPKKFRCQGASSTDSSIELETGQLDRVPQLDQGTLVKKQSNKMTNSEGSRASQRRMVEGESSNARERRLKMQADLERMIRGWKNLMQRDMSLRIGVNLVQEEGNGSPNEEGSDETESEEEGEEVNQLVDEDDKRGTKMSQWRRLRRSKRRRMSSPCTKSTTMLSSPWTLWRPSTHMMTHERPWIFEDVELFDELDRAELDQGWGYITFLAKGEKKMVTFRQLEILFGFTMEKESGTSRKKNSKEYWATIAKMGYSSSRSKAARSEVCA
ncbi:unnamed protein product [Microthlaspi erraticum]|uniref:Arabidopsis retrotransposon Orf1 C-terminal domain-containing protein n=1 Tax=Microthlaspi erraticum TaxID=1685480 RepID=A0A6D2IJF0_9BRAS|nr:unnamed protein product [Microthlaspi erraticum]